MGGACGIMGKREMCRGLWCIDVDSRGHLKISYLDGMIILKGDFRNEKGGRDLDSSGSR
jgi:hypothetical protein